ncbi:MAG: peptide deformylase [Actinomycetota bacterium]
MALLEIRKFGDPVLRERAPETGRPTELHRRLVEDMLETMRDAPGVGLAAPQVGVLERIFVWEVEDEHGAIFDPVIVESSPETVEEEEGCLSLPGLYYPVERAEKVVVTGQDLEGRPLKLEAEGLLARVCQHEIDHLDGVLFIDRLSPVHRKEALSKLRDEAFGISHPPRSDPAEGSL